MCISRSPAAFAQPGGVIMCHESAGTNYQLALSDGTQNNNMDNPVHNHTIRGGFGSGTDLVKAGSGHR